MLRQVCPTCASDESVTVMENDDGEVELVCVECPYSWQPKVEVAGVPARNGYAAELGVYDDLLACLHQDDGWTEHGVIEHRYRALRPETYHRELLSRYGHHADGSHETYSVSKFLAGAMGQLRREGVITNHRWKPTGYWARLGAVSYWAWSDDTDPSHRLTWASYAETEGLDPDTWSLDPEVR